MSFLSLSDGRELKAGRVFHARGSAQFIPDLGMMDHAAAMFYTSDRFRQLF
jgi:hypothetical protein